MKLKTPRPGPGPPAAPGPSKPPARARGWLGTRGHHGEGTCPAAPHATPAWGTPTGIGTPSRGRAPGGIAQEQNTPGGSPASQVQSPGHPEAMQEHMKSTTDLGPAALPRPTPAWSLCSQTPEHRKAGQESLPPSWLSLQTCTPGNGWSWHLVKCLEEES